MKYEIRLDSALESLIEELNELGLGYVISFYNGKCVLWIEDYDEIHDEIWDVVKWYVA